MYDQCRKWVTLHIQSHHIASYDKQKVSDIAHWWKEIFSYDEQQVSDIAHFVKGGLIFSCGQQRVSYIAILWKAASPHPIFLWPTASELHCKVYERQSHHIFFIHQQKVSDLWKAVTSSDITNSLWVTLHIFWKAVSLYLFLLPTGSEASFNAHFVKDSLITSFAMTNRLWVTLHTVWKAVVTLIQWTPFPIASEWHCTSCEGQPHYITNRLWVVNCTFCKSQSHHIFSICMYVQQVVSTLHISWRAFLSYFFLWPIGSEQHCTFCEWHSHHIFSITNSKWVTPYIWWKSVSSYFSYDQQLVSDIAHDERESHHLFLWSTDSEWHWTLCERQSHMYICNGPTGSEWHCTFWERQSHHLFSYA